MANVLARCNGTEMVDHGGELWIVNKPSPPHTASLVLGVLALILLANGIIQGIGAIAGSSWASGIAAAIVLAAGAATVYGLVAMRRSAAALALGERGPSLILAGGRLLDAQRRDIAPLGDVRFRTVMQLTSSSRAMVLEWPTGKMVIARGHPWGDSVAGCEYVLSTHGVAKA